jgi:hypothetical protein
MIKKIIQLHCILFFCISLKAQSVSKKDTCSGCVQNNCIEQLREEAYLHLSRWSVVAGERLYFKAYVFNKKISTQNTSKILYIEIFDDNNKLKAFNRSNIDSGICRSSIVIPDSLTTGLYTIIAYTNLMRNFPSSSFLRSSLIIIGMRNKPVNNTTSINAIDSTKNNYLITNQPIQFISQRIASAAILNGTLEKQIFNPGENVVLNLEIKNADSKPLHGSFSVSVFEKLPDNYSNLNIDISTFAGVLSGDSISKNNISDTEYKKLLFNNEPYLKWLETVKNQTISFPYKSENKAFLLEGTLIDKFSQKGVKGKTIFISTPDSFANIKYCVTDSSGKFMFALDNRYDNRKIFLNVNDNSDLKDYYYVLDNKQIIDSLNSFETLKIDNLMNEFIIKSKKIASINKVYYKSDNMKTIGKQINYMSHFYGRPDYTINLSDYLELDDFKDITENLLPDIMFTKTKGKYSVYIGTLIFQRYPKLNCLVLLNNIPFYDYEYLSKLGSNEIDRIDVTYRFKVYGNLNLPGVLSVYTKDNIIISNRQTLVYENKVENISSAHWVEKEINSKDFEKFPNFKQFLCWEPDLVFDTEGYARLEFFTSDLPTEYLIDIEGITDHGIPVSKKIAFKVK